MQLVQPTMSANDEFSRSFQEVDGSQVEVGQVDEESRAEMQETMARQRNQERQRRGIDPTLVVARPTAGAPSARDANFRANLEAMLGSNQPEEAATTTEPRAANPSLHAAPEQQDYLSPPQSPSQATQDIESVPEANIALIQNAPTQPQQPEHAPALPGQPAAARQQPQSTHTSPRQPAAAARQVQRGRGRRWNNQCASDAHNDTRKQQRY